MLKRRRMNYYNIPFYLSEIAPHIKSSDPTKEFSSIEVLNKEYAPGDGRNVVKAVYTKNNISVVIKKLPAEPGFASTIKNEVSALMKLDPHPYIVPYIGTFVNNTEIWIVLQQMQDCLVSYIPKRLPENAISYVGKQVRGFLCPRISPTFI